MTTKYKNSGYYTFKGKLANRRIFHNYLVKSTPGPGDFTNRTMDADGRTVLSTMKSSGRRHFSI